jgi:simple sugar transport system substrate-binding protein
MLMKRLVQSLAAGVVIAGCSVLGVQAEGMKDPKDVRIVFVVHGIASDPYWSVVKRGVDDAAALTGAEIEYYHPQEFDVIEQARLLDAAIATKPDGIAVSIADADAMRGAVERAIGADIPLVVLDSGEEQGKEMGARLFVGTVSHYDAGVMAAERLAKAGILKVICINNEVGNVALDERCQGINDGLKAAGGGTEVVAVTPDPADVQRRTEAYLSAHPEVQGVFALGASAADPLIPMFREKELFGKIGLYTFDISPLVLESIVAGEMGFAMDAQQYLMGFLPAFYLVENAVHGFWPINNTYTGPLFIDAPEQASAVLALAREGIR